MRTLAITAASEAAISPASPALAKCLLRCSWAVHPSHSLRAGETLPMRENRSHGSEGGEATPSRPLSKGTVIPAKAGSQHVALGRHRLIEHAGVAEQADRAAGVQEHHRLAF